MRHRTPRNHHHNKVRIIAGQWRHRYIRFTEGADLRPTPNRLRETLFNWLTPLIQGAHCLDLFAGSGALGFEALSRGAASVMMIDQSANNIQSLKQNARLLKASNLEIIQAQFPFKEKIITNKAFEIVFLDPPFYKGLVSACCQWLQQESLLAKESHVYIETEMTPDQLLLPATWVISKQQHAGQVYCYLITIQS